MRNANRQLALSISNNIEAGETKVLLNVQGQGIINRIRATVIDRSNVAVFETGNVLRRRNQACGISSFWRFFWNGSWTNS